MEVYMSDTSSIELAHIFKKYESQLHNLQTDQKKAVRAITLCRTGALGGHILKCEKCGHQEIFYNSCRNRHCPKCQFLATEKWILKRQKELLPVSYFHIVFTIPRKLASLVLWNKKILFNIYFKAVSETLKEVALRKKNLGAKIGFITVLHTWTQTVLFHPHIHCIVPGGGIRPGTKTWVHSSPNFFLPLPVLSTVFRAKFLKNIVKEHKKKSLFISPGKGISLDIYDFKHFLYTACEYNWVVYAKRPFAGPKQVINYLSRYTHRIAISNHRIISDEKGKVSFTYRDRKKNNKKKIMTLDALQFLKRFLLHILPSGFMKIRYYGFLGNPEKTKMISMIRESLGIQNISTEVPNKWTDIMMLVTGQNPEICKNCSKGIMVIIKTMLPDLNSS